MPNRHRPRRNKYLKLLLESEDNDAVVKSLFDADRENIVSKLGFGDKQEIQSVIFNRYWSANNITTDAARAMEEQDRLYYGVFEDGLQRDGQTFLNKTKETVKTVYAYLLQLVSQLNPIVSCQPKNHISIHAVQEQYRRSKVMEAMLNFQFDGLWHFRDDVFPLWLKHFLKYSLAIYKVSYREDDMKPDLDLSVVDRAFLRVDPFVRDIKDAKWVCENQYITRSEVRQLVEQGHWDLTRKQIDNIPSSSFQYDTNVLTQATRTRYFGEQHQVDYSAIHEDDLIEVVHYFQSSGKGLDDAYSVFVGGIHGELARHGRNPYPYKGVPYRGKAFDPDESQLDGTSLVEEVKPTQRLLNNIFELRNRDIQNNVLNRKIVAEQLFGEQTQEDWEDGNMLIRGDKNFFEMAVNDPSFDINKYIYDLNIRPSTDNLMNIDMPYLLRHFQETSFVSDALKGQAGQRDIPFATVRESLIRNQGNFRPIYLQVMRAITEVSEICVSYFQSPEFFPVDRIVQVLGKNRYTDVVQGWHNPPGSNLFVRQVTPDEVDVEVTINAISGADAIASKSITNNQIAEILQALGQIPGAFEKMQETKDVSKLFDIMVENIGADIDQINLTPEEIQQRKSQQQQDMQLQQQMLMEQQQQLAQIETQKMRANAEIEMQKQSAIQQSRAQAQSIIDQNKGQLTMAQNQQMHQLDLEKLITQITTKVAEELKADIARMNTEAQLERANAGISVGHSNNISQ